LKSYAEPGAANGDKRLKIVYHHRTASRDGQSTHIEEMIRALRLIGCQVEEAAPSVVDSSQTGGSAGWVGKLKLYLPRGLYELAELGYSIVAYRRLSRKLRTSRPHGIYERYNLYLLAGAWAKKRHRLPLILEVNAPMALERRQYGGLSWPRLADWAERYVWLRADIVLPVSRVLADHIIAQGVPAERVVVLHNGVDESHYENLITTEEAKQALGLHGKLVIGFTGFVREWDRLDRIVTWLASQSDATNAHLLVVGDGPARTEIEACAARLNVSDRVSFTGVVPRERVPALAMAFDIALQTALVPYASPLCLFEYLALGKAVVAPDQPNHHEILEDQVDSILYATDSDQGIEKALDALVSDAQLRERIASRAREVIGLKHLTWRENAQTVDALFRRLCGECKVSESTRAIAARRSVDSRH
jgi:glycosyltransferase involved in cell wall biosynthesis